MKIKTHLKVTFLLISLLFGFSFCGDHRQGG